MLVQFPLFHENSIGIFFKKFWFYTNCVLNFFFIEIFAETEKSPKPDISDIDVTSDWENPSHVVRLVRGDYGAQALEDYFNQALTYRSEWGVPIMPLSLTGFQRPGSLEMATLICVHNNIYYILFSILFLVSWFLGFSVFINYKGTVPFTTSLNPNVKNPDLKAACFESCSTTEISWTIFPSFLLLAIGYPGIALLYSLDNQSSSDFYIKVIGHQWYWTYEYPIFNSLDDLNLRVSVDSNLAEHKLASPKMTKGFDYQTYMNFYYLRHPEFSKKYLHVDYPLIIPANINVKFIVTSDDVLHSWAIPSLGVKIDACPGRLNQIEVCSNFETGRSASNFDYSAYRGQCSEFCGLGHGFMPIVVKAIAHEDYFYFFYKYMLLLGYYDWTHEKAELLAVYLEKYFSIFLRAEDLSSIESDISTGDYSFEKKLDMILNFINTRDKNMVEPAEVTKSSSREAVLNEAQRARFNALLWTYMECNEIDGQGNRIGTCPERHPWMTEEDMSPLWLTVYSKENIDKIRYLYLKDLWYGAYQDLPLDLIIYSLKYYEAEELECVGNFVFKNSPEPEYMTFAKQTKPLNPLLERSISDFDPEYQKEFRKMISPRLARYIERVLENLDLSTKSDQNGLIDISTDNANEPDSTNIKIQLSYKFDNTSGLEYENVPTDPEREKTEKPKKEVGNIVEPRWLCYLVYYFFRDIDALEECLKGEPIPYSHEPTLDAEKFHTRSWFGENIFYPMSERPSRELSQIGAAKADFKKWEEINTKLNSKSRMMADLVVARRANPDDLPEVKLIKPGHLLNKRPRSFNSHYTPQNKNFKKNSFYWRYDQTQK